MTWKKWYQKAKEFVSELNFWVRFGFYVVPLIVVFLIWGRGVFFSFNRENALVLWFGIVSACILALLVWTWRLRQQLTGGYSDNFSDLDGWDHEGWRLAGKGTLVVTGSDAGGITKVGSHWENYTFTFKAKIINKCLGVIVRAYDQNNYYMFQIRAGKVRPHRRITVPVIVSRELSDDSEVEPRIRTIQHIEYKIIWQMDRNTPEFDSVPITPNLKEEFDVKIIVRGQSLNLSIGENFEKEWPSFLQIPTGKVGFRNMGNEEAHVKNVKVTLQN